MEGMPGIPTRYRLRVKQRLTVVEYAKEYGIKPASRQFGLNRVTVRQWWRNWQRAGIQGLVPQYPARRRRRIGEHVVALITQARLEHRFGANRTQIWLARVHEVRVATATIQRVFRDIGVPHLVKTRRRRPKQLKLFEKEHPGDSVQIDVKVVVRGRSKWFQYTAIDDCTRVRILRLYRRQNHHSSLAFLRELTTAFPFQIRKTSVDTQNRQLSDTSKPTFN
jgi:transposase